MRPVFLVCGILTAGLGVTMLVPALVDFGAGNDDWMVFLAASAFTTLVGLVLFLATNGAPRTLSTRQAMLMTVLSWLFLVTFGAIPFLWSGAVPSYTDAFFESMSGLTTTGSTVITGLDNAPLGILFWRALLQWLGGLGIIVMSVAVLPMLQIGGMQLFKAEAFDTPEKILPRAAQISGSLTLVYVILTAACMLAFMATGMGEFDAIAHSFSTVATGGFSTHDNSLGHFENGAVHWVAIFFMIAGCLPFLMMVHMLRGQFMPMIKNSQVQVFIALLVVFSIYGWFLAHFAGHETKLASLRVGAFNVTSIMTGTGFAIDDYGTWGAESVAFFFSIMFIGGCAGSTSCGIKIFRFQVLFADVTHQIRQTAYPNGVFIKRFNGRPLEDRISAAVMSFFFVFAAAFVLLSVLLQLTGLDFITAISGAGTALSNVGPGLGNTIGPSGTFKELNDPAKWLLSAGMLLGRLELFTVLVLLLPRFWRD